MDEDMGKQKWVNVDKLSHRGRILINFEPDEIVYVKGFKFKVLRIVLDPSQIVLEPQSCIT